MANKGNKGKYSREAARRNRIVIGWVLAALLAVIASMMIVTGLTPKVEETASRQIANEISIGDTGRVLTKEERKEIRNSDAWAEIFAESEKYSGALLKDLDRNEELLSFVLGYPEHKGEEQQGTLTDEEVEADCPLLLQWDPRWGYVSYGSDVIGICGCGPTCLSMVLTGLTHTAVDPVELAEIATAKSYYVSGAGTAWAFMTETAADYGVKAEMIKKPTEDEAIWYLKSGALFVLSVSAGDFTDTGHFVVVRGNDSEGFIINDPFSCGNSAKTWNWQKLMNQTKQVFLYRAN